MKGGSTTALSLALLKRRYGKECVAYVQTWVNTASKGIFERRGFRRDLFNFCDILAVDHRSRVLRFIQVCQQKDLTQHTVKIQGNLSAWYLLRCLQEHCTVEIWAWAKRKTSGNTKVPEWTWNRYTAVIDSRGLAFSLDQRGPFDQEGKSGLAWFDLDVTQ